MDWNLDNPNTLSFVSNFKGVIKPSMRRALHRNQHLRPRRRLQRRRRLEDYWGDRRDQWDGGSV